MATVSLEKVSKVYPNGCLQCPSWTWTLLRES